MIRCLRIFDCPGCFHWELDRGFDTVLVNSGLCCNWCRHCTNLLLGLHRSSWEVLDFMDVVVHVFTQEQREFYGLEAFYGAAEVGPSLLVIFHALLDNISG